MVHRRLASTFVTGAMVATCIVAAGCGQSSATQAPAPQAAAQGSQMSTDDVLKAHMAAFGASDVEAMLNGYSDDAVMFTPMGVIQGKAELRKTFTGLFAEWGKPTTKFTLHQRLVNGEHAYIFWDAETDANRYEGGQDAFVIRNGKKVAHFFSAKITPKTAKP
jgi:ketosteroid isomerase-like protein